jgi:hypothetical protein
MGVFTEFFLGKKRVNVYARDSKIVKVQKYIRSKVDKIYNDLGFGNIDSCLSMTVPGEDFSLEVYRDLDVGSFFLMKMEKGVRERISCAEGIGNVEYAVEEGGRTLTCGYPNNPDRVLEKANEIIEVFENYSPL